MPKNHVDDSSHQSTTKCQAGRAVSCPTPYRGNDLLIADSHPAPRDYNSSENKFVGDKCAYLHKLLAWLRPAQGLQPDI